MSGHSLSANERRDAAPPLAEVGVLLDRLSSELGIILAHAELLETSASAEPCRTRSGRIVATALEAMSTSREIALHLVLDRRSA